MTLMGTTNPARPTVAAPTRRLGGRPRTVVAVLLAVASIAALLTTGSAWARVPAGTTVGGLSVEGLDRTALVARLTEAVAAERTPVRVQLGDRTLVLPAGTSGLSVDVPATVERVLEESAWNRLVRSLLSRQGTYVAPVLREDAEALAAAVRRLTGAAFAPETRADLRYARGDVELLPARAGTYADAAQVEATLRTAAARLPIADELVVPVLRTTDPQPPPAAVMARARAVLRAGVVLTAGDASVALRAEDVGPKLTILTSEDGSRLALRESALAGLAATAASRLSTVGPRSRTTAPVPVILLEDKGDVRWRPRAVAVQADDAGRPSRTVTAPAVFAALSSALSQDAPFPAAIGVPSALAGGAASGQAMSVTAVLGSFTTRFACCEPRVTNIRQIARALDGRLVRAGEQLSLNTVVGRRTREKGYVPAPFISGGQLSIDVGGGVSQFATTMFNAAFFAGLQLDDHKAHSFYISRYPPGREATINYPEIDLAWTNDTGNPVLVRTMVSATSVTVAIYGRDDGRTVTSTTVDSEPAAGGGFRTSVRRTVELPGRPTGIETFTTRYGPTPR